MVPTVPFNPFDYPPFDAFPPELLRFFTALKRNNRREWFEAHREDYERHVREPLIAFVAAMAREFPAFAPGVVADPKRCIFRIYRDIRFSKDKSPYKTNAAVWFPVRQEKECGGYYVHVSPSEFLLGGGIWRPPAPYVRTTREKIVREFDAFRAVIGARPFRAMFGGLDTEDALARVPRPYPADHPAADYLKLKSYLVGISGSPQEATRRGFFARVVRAYRTMTPFVRFLP